MAALSTIIPGVASELVLPDFTAFKEFFQAQSNRIAKNLQPTSDCVLRDQQPRPTDVLHHLKEYFKAYQEIYKYKYIYQYLTILQPLRV